MALSIEQVRAFHAKDLESRNDVEKTAIPVPGREVEWSLIQIVILLTEIKNELAQKTA